MWYLKIHTGPQAGKVISLRDGSQILGRSPTAHLKLHSPGVSKEHLKFDVMGDRVVVTDLGSRNGTFVNGFQIKSQPLKPFDKITVHDVLLEILPAHPSTQPQRGNAPMPYPQQGYPQHPQGYPQHMGYPPPGYPQGAPEAPAAVPALNGFLEHAKSYINRVVMPGIYKLPEWMSFHHVLAVFVGVFIVIVTSLSSIPLMRILKTSVEQESQRRALTIARNMAQTNRQALMQNLESGINIVAAQREPGVDEALIISQIDGSIIAPANRAGRYPEKSFVHAARKITAESVEQLDSNTIGAAVPIEYYNSETGTQSISAYAIVIYNMGALAVDDSRTISLFIQTFFIALVVGSILFFMLYKLIQYPYEHLNKQIDQVLKEGGDLQPLNFQLPELQKLMSSVSSLLVRAASATESENPQAGMSSYDRSREMSQMAQLVGFPAMVASCPDQLIQSVNPAFEQLTGLNSSDLMMQPLHQIKDQALKLNFQDLVQRASSSPSETITNRLEFSGIEYDIVAQTVWGSNELAYILFVIVPTAQGAAA